MDGLTPDDVVQRLESLWQGIAQPPRFREDSRDHALVYGYARLSSKRASHVQACRRVLVGFCGQERLRLSGMFIDQDTAHEQIQRPGFSGLCDVLRLPDSFAAVVVDADHLSPDAETAVALVGRIRSTGARLLTVRATTAGALRTPRFSDGVIPEWWQ